MLGPQRFGDEAAPGQYDFKRAFKQSCNTYFYHYGLQTGMSNLMSWGHKFHLGEPCDLPTLQNSRGYFPTRESVRRQSLQGNPWTDGDTLNLSIGQGEITVNPVQMAIMTAAIANGGKVLWPRLVQRIEPLDSLSPPWPAIHFPARVRNELDAQPRHLAALRDAMLADVEEGGTGKNAAVPGFRIGGKTGTAEIKKGRNVIGKTTWFTAFGPYEAPRFVVVVMIEGGVFGGVTCAPVARDIFKAIQARLNEKPAHSLS
jgi:penicillin-binding protein 2